ncbi:hypothetical protein PFMALIP_04400 [Plasmodium falciparum MaliPS096_E11]|uniref:Uncharacterized protein n=1 Tax=Plasmodium falciparum MaliPS096_E11 TaxID=1036727 RepID=A0A024WKN3_PLAFA|nr:hypothetical protein PFMALIP_04400 [Plasmodium falciparum MaliPS096_E11]
MNHNKINYHLSVKDDEIKKHESNNKYGIYKYKNEQIYKTYDDKDTPNYINNFYDCLDTFCDNVGDKNEFEKNKVIMKSGTTNVHKHYDNTFNKNRNSVISINNINSAYRNETDNKPYISNSVPKYLNNNLLIDENIFKTQNNDNNENIRKFRNISYSEIKHPNYNYLRRDAEPKCRMSNERIYSYNKDNYINPRLKDNYCNISNSPRNNRDMHLQIRDDNCKYVEKFYTNCQIQKGKEKDAYNNNNNSSNNNHNKAGYYNYYVYNKGFNFYEETINNNNQLKQYSNIHSLKSIDGDQYSHLNYTSKSFNDNRNMNYYQDQNKHNNNSYDATRKEGNEKQYHMYQNESIIPFLENEHSINDPIIKIREKEITRYQNIEYLQNNEHIRNRHKGKNIPGENMMFQFDKIIEKKVNISYTHHEYVVRNKNKPIEYNKDDFYFCKDKEDSENMMKCDLKIMNEQDVIHNINDTSMNPEQKKKIIRLQNDNNLYNEYDNYDNDMNMFINKIYKNNMYHNERMPRFSEYQIYKNSNVMYLNKSDNKQKLMENINCHYENFNSKNNASLLPVQENRKNDNGFYMNSQKYMKNILKEPAQSEGSFYSYEKGYHNYNNGNKASTIKELDINMKQICKDGYDVNKKIKKNQERKECNVNYFPYKTSAYEDKTNNTTMNMLKKVRTYSHTSSDHFLNNSYVNKNIQTTFQDHKQNVDDNSYGYIVKNVEDNYMSKLNNLSPRKEKMNMEHLKERKEQHNRMLSSEKNCCFIDDNNETNYNRVVLLKNIDKEIEIDNISEHLIEERNNNSSLEYHNLKQNGNDKIPKGKDNMCDISDIYNKNIYTNENKFDEFDEFAEIYDNINKDIHKSKENNNFDMHDRNKHIKNEEDEFLEIYHNTKGLKNIEMDEFLEITDKSKKTKENNVHVDEFLEIINKNKNINESDVHVDEFFEIIEDTQKMKNNEIELDEFFEIIESTQKMKNKENELDEFFEIVDKTQNVNNKEVPVYINLENHTKDDNINKNSVMNNMLFENVIEKEANINIDFVKEEEKDTIKSFSRNYTYNTNAVSNEENDINLLHFYDAYETTKGDNKQHKSFMYASGKEVIINKDILKEMREKIFDDDKDTNYSSEENNKGDNKYNKELTEKIVERDMNLYMDRLNEEKDILKPFPRNFTCNTNVSSNEEALINLSELCDINENAKITNEQNRSFTHKLFDNDDGYNNYGSDQKIRSEKKNILYVSHDSEKSRKVVEDKILRENERAQIDDNKNGYEKNIEEKCVRSLSCEYRDKGSEDVDMTKSKEQELYKLDKYDDYINKKDELNKDDKNCRLLDKCTLQMNKKRKMRFDNISNSKRDFINPRQRKQIKILEEEKNMNIYNKNNNINNNNKCKKLNLKINVRNYVKLIKDNLLNISIKKKIKDCKLTNTLIYINENKTPFHFHWFKDDYIYFYKNKETEEYYICDINILYELFILTLKEMNLFDIYDFNWFYKKYKLISISLNRTYRKNLKKNYKSIKKEIMNKIIRDNYLHNDIAGGLSIHEYYDNFIYEYLNAHTYINLRRKHIKLVSNGYKERIYLNNEKEGTNHDNKNKWNNYEMEKDEFIDIKNLDDIKFNEEKDFMDKLNKMEYKELKKKNYMKMIIKSIDETEAPCPLKFMYKLLKRYLDERSKKKSILQLLKDRTISSKISMNLRVEEIIIEKKKTIKNNKNNEHNNNFNDDIYDIHNDDNYNIVLILSDNFDYIHCFVKDDYLKNFIISEKIRKGNIIKINALDIYNNNMGEGKENHGIHTIYFLLSSNDLIEIDKKDTLKIGFTKYKAKKIRCIQDFGSTCFFIDVIMISKSDFSYGFYDQVKKKYYLLNRNVYEKLIYNLKNEITKMFHEENFKENNEYIRLKNELTMFLEATPFCTIQAIDYSSLERIKDTDSYEDKIGYLINSLCQIKMFKIDEGTYESLRKGSRIQLFNVFVQKSNHNNNKFNQFLDDHVLDDFLFNTFNGKIHGDNIKRALNYHMFESRFLKDITKINNDDITYDKYLQCIHASVLKKKHYAPIVFQALHSTYINIDEKYKSKLFEQLEDVLKLQNYIQLKTDGSIVTKETKEIKEKTYPSFIYTNIYKIPVLSSVHFHIFKNYIKQNNRENKIYFDLIQGNLYYISGVVIHYTDVEIKDIIDFKCAQEKKKLLNYKIFLLTSNGHLCCVNVSMTCPDFLISSCKKDYENKEREILKKMIHVYCVEEKEKKNNNKVEINNSNKKKNETNTYKSNNVHKNHKDLFNYLYKTENTNYEEGSSKYDINFKNFDMVLFFKDIEFINYDDKNDIFNFRSYTHPHFDSLKMYSNEFIKMKGNMEDLIKLNYITFEKNKIVIKLEDHCKIKVDKNNISSMHFLYLLIYSKCKSIELTGVCVENNYLSTFLKNIWNIFVP